jgi:eukaryotic-like serine/threonine-protein kinase
MAALTPVASVDALVSVIQKSGLLTAEKLVKVREAAAKATDAKQLARELVKDGTLTRWQAGQLINGYHLLVIGKYKLMDQIGTAPTGRLYLAEHAQIGRRHTLKVLAKRLASKPQAVKQFLTAAQNACGLDHHNISHVYDVNQEGDRHYVVMEYVEGEDLEHLIEREGPLKLPEALSFIAQAAEGLAHAHDNGVVHGDLKPSNLLRDNSGTIKILEIGQTGTGAAWEAEGADESVEMAALGAVIFQAPELRGDGEVADVACDVYSLGSVLCFLLTGKVAPDAAAAVKLLQSTRGVPERVIDLCSRMMADKPDGRPRTIGIVLDQLVAAAQGSAPSQEATALVEASPNEDGTKAKREKQADPANKPKKPPVAKAIADDGSVVIVIPDGSVPVKSPEPMEPFSIKTKGRAGKQPGGKNAKTASPPPTGAPADGKVSDDDSAAEPAAKILSPLVLAGAIGGGALVLGLIIALVCLFALGGSKKDVAQNGSVPAKAVAPKVEPRSEPTESNPEPPSEINPEVNPVATIAPAQPPPAELAADSKAAAPSASAAGSSADANAAADTAPAAAKKEDAAEKKPEPKDQPKPEAKPEPPPPKTESKPAAKPAAPKPAPKPDPFKGLAKAVSLPELPEATGQPSTDAMSPLVLGPCKLDAGATLVVSLLGADGAIRGSRQKFDLVPKAGAAREWDFFLTGGAAPVAIATLAAKEGNLVFQWTDEAVKQAASARQLCNCALDLTAETRHIVTALRTPVRGEPLKVEIDKASPAVRWNIGALPMAKQMFIEVTRTEGIKAHRQEPKGPVSVGETFTVGTGKDDKSVALFLKLTTSSTARTVDVKLQPQVKLEGQELRNYRRKELLNLQPQIAQEIPVIEAELKKTKDKRPSLPAEKQLQETRVASLANELLNRSNALDQIVYLTSFADNFPGTALMHFRVYYQSQSGDTQIDLLRTEDEPPPARAK